MENQNRLKAAIYHRVSTIDQDSGLAHEDLRNSCIARGFEITLDIEETGSGAKNDRPGLQTVLDAAMRRKVDVVVVWKLDRFGRSSLDVLTNIQKLRSCGVRFIVMTQGIDVGGKDDAVSALTVNILAAVAEFERELIRERTRLGMAKAKMKGVKLGPPITLTVDPKEIQRLKNQGLSWTDCDALLKLKPGGARGVWRRFKRTGV